LTDRDALNTHMKLKTAEVTRYARWRAAYLKLEKKVNALRDHLKELLEQGYTCPETGPYLVALQPAEGNVSWKDDFLAYLTAQVGAEEAAKILAEREAKADRKSYNKLITKTNPRFELRSTIRRKRAAA
jgi:hypothetical protein